jgi:carbonic anhydrase
VSDTDDLRPRTGEHVASFEDGELTSTPARRLAVVACMDTRLDPYSALGLLPGDAHIIRNAGGAVTDDVIRSLTISQRVGDTVEVVLVHHTDCAMQKILDDEFTAQVEAETGVRPQWPVESFRDLEDHVRRSMARIESSPFLTNTERVRGFVYDVQTGRAREVQREDQSAETDTQPSPGS